MPLLIDLQNRIISLPQIQKFIKNNVLYYPLGDSKYVQHVNTVLGKKI